MKEEQHFKILYPGLLKKFTAIIGESPLIKIAKLKKVDIPVDYFEFYKSISSVYSSKIEGEDIDFDSYFKYKFLNVKFKPNYTRKADDLYAAYDFIDDHTLTLDNVQKAHAILSAHLLPKSEQGKIRSNPMFVLNHDDQIDYVAAKPKVVKEETHKLFDDIAFLLKTPLTPYEIFYYAALLHLTFVKIHPFQDGNGRTARLIEKWFLKEKLGDKANQIPLEKNYYKKLKDYYANIKKLGIEYEYLDYTKSLDFLLMTVSMLDGKI